MPMIQNIDFMILDFIQLHFKSELLDQPLLIISLLGNKGAVWLALALLLLLIPHLRKGGLLLFYGLALDYILCNLLLKNFVQRARPCDIRIVSDMLLSCPSDFSFPSGHTMAAFVCSRILLHIDKRLGFFAYIFAFLTAFSRLYLYVHFPSDVIAGALLGTMLGVFVTSFAEKKPLKNIEAS